MQHQTPEAVRALLRDQSGLATRQQLLAAGLTRAALDWRVGRSWRYVLPSVVSTEPGRLDEMHRHRAALLWGGEKAILSGSAAARYFGSTATPKDPRVRLLVPHPQSSRRDQWAHAHRTRVPEGGVVTAGGRRWASKPRAIVDAARWTVLDRDARAIVIEAVQRRIVAPDELAHELSRGSRRGSARLWRALDEAAAGSWSVPEAEVAELIARMPDLPEPWLNPQLRLPDDTVLVSPDVWFDDVALALMVHSWQHHAVGEDWTRTVLEDSELASAGALTIGIPPRALRSRSAAVERVIRRAYQSAAARPRPSVIATPRNGFR